MVKNKKHGFLLIDVVVALSIFLILASLIFYFLIIENKYFRASKESVKNSSIIEAVRKELKYNLEVKECKERFYINKNNLDIDILKGNKINSLIATQHDGELPYVEISIFKNDLYEIKYLWKNGKDQVEGEIYRRE